MQKSVLRNGSVLVVERRKDQEEEEERDKTWERRYQDKKE
jgi:hypothetical protein